MLLTGSCGRRITAQLSCIVSGSRALAFRTPLESQITVESCVHLHMSSDRDYTDSELRLLACYKALQEIKVRLNAAAAATDCSGATKQLPVLQASAHNQPCAPYLHRSG
jgi:predicted MarR family transcription regulator